MATLLVAGLDKGFVKFVNTSIFDQLVEAGPIVQGSQVAAAEKR